MSSASTAERRAGRAGTDPSPVASGAPTDSPGLDLSAVVVIGLGNPILGDDGVGWRVVDALEARHREAIDGIRVERAALGGLALMERLVGAQRAILVDAMETGTAPIGTVTCLRLDDVGCRPAGHLDSVHDTPLTVAIEAGRALGADLPDDVSVVAVEAHRIDTFSDFLSPDVEAAIPAAVDAVLRLLEA
jgi:hydrogenase maturation protease